RDIFKEYIEIKTKEDGSDLGNALAQLFQVLNEPKQNRLKTLDEHMMAFPYVNGKLFEEIIPIAAFNSEMREIILECSGLDWGKISPAIFGSLFQSVMDPEERRNLGAHYTSEKNILKLIKPLFLDELKKEFEKVKGNSKKLREFHKKLAGLTFLDPACGCGNFLVITYRELRLLELEVLKALYKNQQVTGIEAIVNVDVDQFYGIEYDEWPARIAEVALWLMDHQMNLAVSEEFGLYYARLPLKKSATVIHGNALKTDWKDIIPPKKLNYILGNPPFYGKQYQTKEQKQDMKLIFDKVKGSGVLDYVTAWYVKAADYIQGTKIKVAFVSTNSIAQGEQVGVLWNELFKSYKLKIHFAHRTFKWTNEAKGKAAVHVVIIGFGNFDVKEKYIFDYEDIKGEPDQIKANNINPYLVQGDDVVILRRSNPICDVPEISYGSMANDGGNLIFSNEEKEELLKKSPESEKFIKPFLGSKEFINGIQRWCIWLENESPHEYKSQKLILERIKKVREKREASSRKATRKLAKFPMLFGEIRQPKTDYLLIPGVSSENRIYIPVGFLSKEIIASDLARTISNANHYLFGVVTSKMHMAWVKYVCGRLKSDFRYSNTLVYNNFPWPKEPSAKNKKMVEERAQMILDVRAEFKDSSLADLYDALTMPPKLVKAHQKLDKAVDLCYRPQPFTTETNRIEFLFELYKEYTEPLLKGE
ncbi:MAG: DNA methyltransferase, partial [Candidatus Paceibacterota bacterium]